MKIGTLMFLVQFTQSMTISRFIQVYIVQGIYGLFYIYMAILILNKDRKRINQILSSFYLSVGIGVIINIIYAGIYIEVIVEILHFITYFLFCFALIFLLLFVLILSKSEDLISDSRQLAIVIIFAILLLFLLLIPNGFQVNADTGWVPVWETSFVLYGSIICLCCAIIPCLLYAISLFKKFENEDLKKKWKYFILGISSYFFVWAITSISNTLNNSEFRVLTAILTVCTIPSVYLIYYGVGKQL